MKRFALIMVLLFAFSLGACSSDLPVDEKDNELPKEEEPKKEESQVSKSVIELQGFNVNILEGYTATGGHDGVKYVNALLTPTDPKLTYEIEVGYGMASVSDDYDGVMFVRGHYNNTTVTPVLAEDWISPCLAYTFIRSNDNDSSSFIDFQPEKGPSQVMGCYNDYRWLEAELRATSGSITDYPDALEKFMAQGIDWQD